VRWQGGVVKRMILEKKKSEKENQWVQGRSTSTQKTPGWVRNTSRRRNWTADKRRFFAGSSDPG